MEKRACAERRDFFVVEEFGDIRILRYEVPAFERLPLREKLFVYYLSRAALAGRDILWDQNNRYNLRIRKALERILTRYRGERTGREFESFLLYAKQIFFANGIHHHYSMDKFSPGFSPAYLKSLLEAVGAGEEYPDLERIVFDPGYMPKRVVLGGATDLLAASANNYYAGVTQPAAEAFYRQKLREQGGRPVAVGLNSTLVMHQGQLTEEVWHAGGKYGKEISKIAAYLEKAREYAWDNLQQEVTDLLVAYYRSGDLSLFDAYSIAWLKEQQAPVDFINGFIEVYGDPLAYKGSWESVVEITDKEACRRTEILAENALWFERQAPVEERFKKREIVGVTARVMQVAMLGGDCYPATPIGINLPNSEWIREVYGSKSVTFDNITYSCHQASLGNGLLEEFAFSDEELALHRKYGYESGNIHTDLHECLGHGSGKMLSGVTPDCLKSYYSTLEETRADLFALYYIADEKLLKLGVVSAPEVGKCEYNSYIRNGLMTQLTRIQPGGDLEESHMRNRQLIASWVYEKGGKTGVIERVVRDGKTFFVIRDYPALRALFGELLGEVQRIKSEGDYEAARQLIEGYGVKVDRELHAEVLERYAALGIPPYAGFLNPEYTLIKKNGRPVDVRISYPDSFLRQMLAYGEESGR
ncbi:MAG: dipeptidyl peptidase 3 [Culturomica sp.]|nr:dipeptidyl peptidase 3 [Culturomica sp.]